MQVPIHGREIAMADVCPVCGSSLQPALTQWHFECVECRYEGSNLQPKILEQAAGGDLDEKERESALEALRKSNFQRLARRLNTLLGERAGRLLDVGCAHGWFLDAMSGRLEVLGLEPDVAIADAARKRGVAVRSGFFPEALAAEERFDVISFNDVLEHIPDINATFAACNQRLHRGGLLVINAPSRRGVLYRVSRTMQRLGMGGAFDRLWQRGFPSPHVHYLDTRVVEALASRHGFHVEDHMSLPSMKLKGLYSRIRYAKDVPAPKALAIAAALGLAYPLLAILPPDIGVWFLRKTG